MEQRIISKRGESLLVDIAPDRPKETAPLGNPSRPVGPDAPAPPRQAAPPAPPTPPAPKVAPIPPAPPSTATAPAPRPAPPAPKVADAPREAPKAPPAPPKSEEPGPAPKAAPPTPAPAPAPEPTQTAKATSPQSSTPPPQLGAPAPPRVASTPPDSSPTSGMFRRGGGGGLKGGRGGIEGEAIPLDTPDPRYQDYFNQIRERIKSKWIYPYEASSRGIGGELSIEFGIAKSGRAAVHRAAALLGRRAPRRLRDARGAAGLAVSPGAGRDLEGRFADSRDLPVSAAWVRPDQQLPPLGAGG